MKYTIKLGTYNETDFSSRESMCAEIERDVARIIQNLDFNNPDQEASRHRTATRKAITSDDGARDDTRKRNQHGVS